MSAFDAKKSGCFLRWSDVKCLRFGLLLQFGLRCERPRCQSASDVGRAMRATKGQILKKESGPISRDTAILLLRYPYRAILLRGAQQHPKMVRYLPLVLRSRPPFTGVLRGPGPESGPRSAFWAILGTCLGVLFEVFWAF